MAKFSTAEANASTIVTMEKKYKGADFVGWIFGIKDADGNNESWLDIVSPEDAVKVALKSAIKSHLELSVEKQPVIVKSRVEPVDNQGLWETIG